MWRDKTKIRPFIWYPERKSFTFAHRDRYRERTELVQHFANSGSLHRTRSLLVIYLIWFWLYRSPLCIRKTNPDQNQRNQITHQHSQDPKPWWCQHSKVLSHRVDRVLRFFSSRPNWGTAGECVHSPPPLVLGGGGGEGTLACGVRCFKQIR